MATISGTDVSMPTFNNNNNDDDNNNNAHKSIGECSVCHVVRQLRNSTGTVHRHGPRHNPCPGSDKPPVTVRPPASCQNSLRSAAANRQCDASASASTTGTDSAELTHPTLVRRTTRHIPKSARQACAKQYAELLKLCTDDPNNLHAWEDLMNFGRDVLIQPLRGGKRHSLTSIIKKRTIEPFKADNETVTQSYRAKKQDAATVSHGPRHNPCPSSDKPPVRLQYDRLPVVRILSHQQQLTASVMLRLLHRQQEQTRLSSHIQL